MYNEDCQMQYKEYDAHCTSFTSFEKVHTHTPDQNVGYQSHKNANLLLLPLLLDSTKNLVQALRGKTSFNIQIFKL